MAPRTIADQHLPDLAHSLFVEAGDALILFDPDTDEIRDVNPMALRLSGYGRQEMLSMQATYLFRFGGKGGRQRLQQASQKTGIFHAQDGYLLRTKDDGVWIPVNLTIARLHVQPKTLALITARDNREQHQAHARLLKAEGELRRVLTSVSDCLWSAEITPKGDCIYRFISPVVEKIAGRPADYFMADFGRWRAVIHAEDRSRWLEALRELQSGRPVQEEYRIVWPDDSCRWVRDSVRPSRVEAGSVLRLDGVLTDVSERKHAERALQQAEEKYRRIFENAVEGIFQTTREGRFLTANPAVARMLGFESPEALMAQVSDIGRQLHVQPERRAAFQRLLEEKGLVSGFEAQIYRADGTKIWASVNARAVRDATGALSHFEGMVEDITQRKKVEEALQARARQQAAVARLGQRALVLTKLPVLTAEACELAACTLGVDYAALWQLQPGGQELRLRAGWSWRQQAAPSTVIGAGSDSPMGHALLSRAPVVIHDLASDTRFPVAEECRQHGLVSGVAVPIEGTGEPYGVLSVFAAARWEFSTDDIHFLQAVAHVLSTAIERDRADKERRAAEEEFRLARQIQQKLFPAAAPSVSGFDIGGTSHSALATGGDYYDYIPMDGGALGIVIGDVSGHGFGPALLMASGRSYLRGLAQRHADASEILSLANRVLFQDTQGDTFITLLLGRLDPTTRTFAYASAGHLTCYVLDRAGQEKTLLKSTGIPLGVEPEARYRPVPPVQMEPGDMIVLLTDGIVEARSPSDDPFGPERSLDVVRAHRDRKAQEIVGALYAAVTDFCRGKPLPDDVTGVIVKAIP
jgi:PAS domain S-box-containing protein